MSSSHLLAQEYSFEYFGQEHGLSSSLVRAMAQDKQGFLWIGTRNGLYRYDGVQFQAFQRREGLPEDSVRAVHASASDSLWVGTSSGVVRKVGNRFVPVSPPNLQVNSRTGIASDSQGRVYLATSGGVYVSDGGDQFTPLLKGNPWQTKLVAGLHVAPDDSIWFGCDRAVCRYKNGRLESFGREQGVPDDQWGGFQQDHTGRLWVRSSRALLSLEKDAKSFVPDPDFRSTGSNQLLLDSRNQLVAPSESGIWIRKPDGVWRNVTQDNGLPANRVNYVLEDREGALWAGFADFGIARWRGRDEWQGWNRSLGLSDNEVRAIARTPDGAVWAGTRRGLNRLDPNTLRWRQFFSSDGLPADDVRSLAVTPDGKLWVASATDGLSVIDTRTLRISRIGASSGLQATKTLSLYVDPRGRLWVACREGLFVSSQISATRFEPAFPGVLLPEEEIYSLRFDSKGVLWMAGNRGLLRMAGDKWQRFSETEGLRSRLLVFLTVAKDDTVWVGYGAYAGVSRLWFDDRTPRFEHYDREGVLASNDICVLSADSRGWVWVATDNGVDVFNGSQWRHISTHDGLIWHDVVLNSFLLDDDGSVWIGTNRGLSRFSPNDTLFQRKPPGVALTGVLVGGEAADSSGLVSVPFDQRSIRIGFHTLSFSRRHATRFRYRLRGLDNNWVETREREVLFSNLSAGSYEFEVQAGTGGEWNSESAVVRFRILSPWWRTAWFQALMILIATCGATSVYLQRIRRIRRQQAELERAVEERTHELQMEKNRTETEKQIVEAQKQEIEKLLESAQQASRLKGEFLANVSHEIRTPMNGILGMTSLALQTPLQPDQREYLEIARNSGEALLALLNDILDFSKIEANRMEFELVPFLLSDCLQAAAQTFASQAQEKGILLETEIDSSLPLALVGDPSRLRQVLLNLLSNSVKFTQTGKVILRACTEQTEGSFFTIRFEVEDTGPGIPEEKQGLIFEAFRQADGSTTRRYGGTGLGLAISSRLVQMMGGSIRVESTPGKGSLFSFTARFQAASIRPQVLDSGADALRMLASAVEGRMRPLRILVAEDNVVNQKVVVRLLEKQGHEVDVAVDGGQALSLVNHKHFDLILMDVQMPEIDGLEATRQIRRNEMQTGGRIPILMLTASAMAGDREKCLEAGADGYLPKPVSLERLTAAIEQVAILR